ncbi:MAG: glycerol-3-phosphate 1-O-acyltransferase PlsY [Filifactoraceae bacterium]
MLEKFFALTYLYSAVILIICYFVGNFSPSYWITKYLKKVDIREVGSGNAGSTNTLRFLGKKAAIMVFVLDFLKGFVCSFVALKYMGSDFAFLCSLAVVVGHVFPILMGFKGGKGVATAIGSIMAIQPFFVFIGLGMAIIAIMKTRYVSLGSIVGVFTFTTLMYITGHRGLDMGASTALLFFILYTHRENIKRMISGSERRLGSKN